MADRVVAVDANAGSVYLRPDGTAYGLDVYAIGAPTECSYMGGPQRTTNIYGTPVGPSDCTAGLRNILPTLDPTVPQLLLTELSGRLVDQVGTLGSAALTALSGAQLASISPILSAFEGSETLQSIGLVPLLEAIPGLGQAIQYELAVNTQARVDAGDATSFLPDSASNYNQFQRYLMALEGAERLEPVVSAERQRAVGILEDLGITGFASGNGGGFSLPNFSLPTSFGNFPTAGAPESSGSGGGAIDTIGSALINVIAAASRAGLIRGSVGALFNPQQAQAVVPQGAVAMGGASSLVGGSGVPTLLETLALALAGGTPTSTGDGTMMGGALAGLENLFGVNQGAGCGSRSLRVPMAGAMALYKMGCGKAYIPRRIFVDGPDGVPHVLYNAGPATIGSREAGLAKSIARRSGYKLTRYGTGGARRRRRSPR